MRMRIVGFLVEICKRQQKLNDGNLDVEYFLYVFVNEVPPAEVPTDDDEVIDDQNYEAPDTSSGKRGKQGEDDIDPNRYMGL